MSDDRYVLVYHPDDTEAPANLRTWTLTAAQLRVVGLRKWQRDHPEIASKGRWAVHKLGSEEPA